MRVFVLGASGATGKQVVKELIKRKIHTRVLIRESAVVSQEMKESSFLEILKGNINEVTDDEMITLLHDCSVIISCLGHNLTLKGMFGKPYYLVFHAIKKVCESVKQKDDKEVKLILMSTSGYTNTISGETNSLGEKIIHFFLKHVIPPHRDNVKAADFLLHNIGKEDKSIQWVAVRPDSLVNHEEISHYKLCESPERSPIFNAGKTSRINVGHFMAELATNDKTWEEWNFKTPVIYNENQ